MLKRKLSWMQIVLMLLLGLALVYAITPQVMRSLGLINSPIVWIKPEWGAYELLFTPDNRFLVTHEENKSIYLRSIKHGNIIRQFDSKGERIRSMALHPSKPWLAASDSNGMVWLWDYDSGQVVHSLAAPVNWTSDLAFSPNGEYIAIIGKPSQEESAIVNVWRLSDFSVVQKIDRPKAGSLAFSSDSKHLIMSDPFEVRTIEDWMLIAKLSKNTPLWNMEVSQNAPYTVVSSYEGKGVYLWDQQNNKLELIASRPNYICAIAISNNGQFVASAPCLPITQAHSRETYDRSEQSIRIWNRADGRLVQEIALPIQDTHTLAFSPDGTMIAAANGLYGPITVWRVKP